MALPKNGSGNRVTVAGFELADIAAYGATTTTGSATANVATDHKRTGAQALKCAAATAERAMLNITIWVVALARFFFRGYIYLTAYPTASRIIWSATTTVTAAAPELRLNADGTISLVTGTSPSSATVYGTSVGVVPLNAWTRIEVGYDNVTDKACVRVDGVTEIDWVAVVAASTTANVTIGVLDTQAQAGAGALTIWWDDVAVDSDDWCGPGQVSIVNLGATVLSTGWTLTVAGSFLLALNKTTADDTSYAESPASTASLLFTLDAFPGGQCRGICAYSRWQRTSATATQLRYHYGVNYASVYIDQIAGGPIAGSTVWAWSKQGYNAWAGGQWNHDRLDDGSFGVGSASATGLKVSLLAHEADMDVSVSPFGPPSGRSYIENFAAGQISPAATIVGTAAISTVQAHSGTYSARVNPAGATASYILLPASFTPPQETFFRAYVYVVARPASGSIRLFGIGPVSAGQELSAFMTSTGAVSVSGGSASAANTIPLNTWTLVELRTARSTANGSGCDVELFVNGVSQSTGTNQGQSAATAQSPSIGNTLGTNMTGVDIYFDDLIVDTVQLPGGDSVITAVASNATTTTGAVLGDSHPSASLTLHAMTDEIPHDGDTTYFGLGLTNNAAIYYEQGWPDTGLDDDDYAIRAIQYELIARTPGAGTAAFSTAPTFYGETPTVSAQTALSTGATYQGRSAIVSLQGHRGALDAAAVDASTLRLQPADTSDETYVTQSLMLYEYEALPITNPNSVGGNQAVVVG